MGNGTSAVPTQGPGGLPNPGLLAGLPGLLASSESGSGEGQLASVYGLMSNIQALIKVAVENAKKEERNNAGNLELKTDSKGLEREMEEVKKNRDIYLRRFKKGKDTGEKCKSSWRSRPNGGCKWKKPYVT